MGNAEQNGRHPPVMVKLSNPLYKYLGHCMPSHSFRLLFFSFFHQFLYRLLQTHQHLKFNCCLAMYCFTEELSKLMKSLTQFSVEEYFSILKNVTYKMKYLKCTGTESIGFLRRKSSNISSQYFASLYCWCLLKNWNNYINTDWSFI